MKNFYISISNALIEPKHVRTMGTAIWEYLWCLDKLTKIENNTGFVLGGKPIKLFEIASSLGKRRESVSINLKKLETAGYLELTHAPYGVIIRITKAKKWFTKSLKYKDSEKPQTYVAKNLKPENSGLPQTSLKKPQTYVAVYHKPNKDNTVDNTVDNTNSDVLDSTKVAKEKISKLYYEAIKSLGVPTTNHNTIRSKINSLAREDTEERVLMYLTFIRDKYKITEWDYKPQINNALDIYSKRVTIENTLKQFTNKGKSRIEIIS